MLTKERLDLFLESSDVQLDTELPGFFEPSVPVMLLKRRVGIHAYLLYCCVYKEKECARLDWDMDSFYHLMVYNPQSEDVFVLISPHTLAKPKRDIDVFKALFHEWYGTHDKMADERCIAFGRKLSEMYVDALLKQNTASDLFRIANVQMYDAVSYSMGEIEYDTFTVIDQGLDIMPDILVTAGYVLPCVYFLNEIPLSEFDKYYACGSESAYLDEVFHSFAASYPPGEFLNPAKDEAAKGYVKFLMAKEHFNSAPIFQKLKAVRAALADFPEEKVSVRITTKARQAHIPVTVFTDKSNIDYLVGSGDEPVELQLWAPGSVKLFSLADLKTISFKGKVLYEDPAL